MKIRINPLHRIVAIAIILATTLNYLNDLNAKPVPRNDGGGCAIGVAVMICGGVVVYCLIRTCKKVFDTNSPPRTNSWDWPSNQSPPCIEIILPCPGESTNQSFIKSGVLTIHELQRTTNFIDWDTIDTQYGEVDELSFSDYDPPQSGALYRLISW